jgi:hypothetical protein
MPFIIYISLLTALHAAFRMPRKGVLNALYCVNFEKMVLPPPRKSLKINVLRAFTRLRIRTQITRIAQIYTDIILCLFVPFCAICVQTMARFGGVQTRPNFCRDSRKFLSRWKYFSIAMKIYFCPDRNLPLLAPPPAPLQKRGRVGFFNISTNLQHSKFVQPLKLRTLPPLWGGLGWGVTFNNNFKKGGFYEI